MNEEKKEAELLKRRTELVDEKLKKLNDKELAEFERILRTYRFVRDKLSWIKKRLTSLKEELEANQKSFVMQIFTRDTYKSNQSYLKMITLEIKEEFYEFEIEKIGIDFIPYQKEWEVAKELCNHQNLSEEEEERHKIIIELYTASLKIKILQRLGY